MRVGRKIILADMKSIITSDSTISHFNAIQRLEEGVDQVIRKSEYISSNLELTFQKLGWEFNEGIDYQVIPCVINSKGLYSGFSIKDIPIVDLRIFTHYFRSSKVSLVTDPNMKDLVWADLYKDFDTLVENFQEYLLDPPQIIINRKYPVVPRPMVEMDLGQDIVNIINLKVNEYGIEDFLIMERNFPIKYSCSIDELLKKLDANKIMIL